MSYPSLGTVHWRNRNWLFQTCPHSPSSPVLVYNAEPISLLDSTIPGCELRLGLQQRLEELGFVWDAAVARELRKQVEGAELGKGN